MIKAPATYHIYRSIDEEVGNGLRYEYFQDFFGSERACNVKCNHLERNCKLGYTYDYALPEEWANIMVSRPNTQFIGMPFSDNYDSLNKEELISILRKRDSQK